MLELLKEQDEKDPDNEDSNEYDYNKYYYSLLFEYHLQLYDLSIDNPDYSENNHLCLNKNIKPLRKGNKIYYIFNSTTSTQKQLIESGTIASVNPNEDPILVLEKMISR